MQIILTTHSPSIAASVPLDNIVMMRNRKSFSLAHNETRLQSSDYRFLERFLDTTKANLFFARAVIIVEGPAESVLIPTLARAIGRDLGAYGVSIVNVGGIGLSRYARIFQRAVDDPTNWMSIRVACVADLDIPPCNEHQRAQSETEDMAVKREHQRERIIQRASGQCVRTFVADEYTLEYDLAYAGLGKEMWIAVHLAMKDDRIHAEGKQSNAVEEMLHECKKRATVDYDARWEDGRVSHEMAQSVVTLIKDKRLSKPIIAQYLSEIVQEQLDREKESPKIWRRKLPKYLVEAIDYVTLGDHDGKKAGVPDPRNDFSD